MEETTTMLCQKIHRPQSRRLEGKREERWIATSYRVIVQVRGCSHYKRRWPFYLSPKDAALFALSLQNN